MGRFERKNFIIFDRLTSVLIFILSLAGIIAFWTFIARGDVYDNWYPLVGHCVSAHGAFIGIILYEYLNAKEMTFRQLWRKIFKKEK